MGINWDTFTLTDEPAKLLPYLMEKIQEYWPMVEEIMMAQSMPAVRPVPMGPVPQYGGKSPSCDNSY